MMEYNNNILIDNIIGDLARASNDNIAKSNSCKPLALIV